MFETARLKLTLLYLLILMTVSGVFSYVIYRFIILDIEQSFIRVERRITQINPNFWEDKDKREYFLTEHSDAREAVAKRLLYINGVIAIVSFSVAYYLASRTLSPIEDAYEKQKRFIADASHELKTPITSVILPIQIALRDKKLNLADSKLVMKNTLKDMEKIKNLTEDLLSLNKYQMNQSNLKIEKINSSEMSDTLLSKFRILAKEKKIILTKSRDKFYFFGDKFEIEKALSIFIDNAIKYTKNGGRVKLTLKEKRRTIELSVKDNGIGIPKTEFPQIFDRFFRVDRSRSRENYDGFGLGLSIAKNIAKFHGGNIKVTSHENQGSTFTLIIPKNMK